MTEAEPHEHTTIEWLNDTDWIFAPSQDRSRKSLQKILSTAQDLFIDKGYDETTITEISRQSGISVGSIYHRFADKLSILYAVLESYRRTRFAQVSAMTAPERWRNKSLADLLDFHIEIIFSSTRADIGILRLIERQRMANPAIADLQVEWNEEFCQVMTRLYRRHADAIKQPDIDRTVHYLHNIIRGSALWSIQSADGGRSPLDIDNDEYRQEAFAMAAAYLGLSG